MSAVRYYNSCEELSYLAMLVIIDKETNLQTTRKKGNLRHTEDLTRFQFIIPFRSFLY